MLDHTDDVKIFKALADKNRLEIMEVLKLGAKCGCELLAELKIGQSTLSHHMSILCEAGLVEATRIGRWTHYSLSEQGSVYVRELMSRYTLSPNEAPVYNRYNRCDPQEHALPTNKK